ncbi:MAG: DUF1343 domain-containing protein [Candidatus Rokubacteria bacterium]|nr:DUF1343 domain-containing protein [Candidatus Rokubacteria bacterium]
MSGCLRRLAVAVLLLVLPLPARAEPLDFSAVDAAARDAVASGEIPGVVVLVGRGDEVLYRSAFGWRTLVPEPEAMTPDTVFDIASLTKPFGTAVAIMALVEKGSVELEAPLGRYLKEFRSSAFKEVTIRRMLTHSAGFPGYPPNGAVKSGFPGAARAIAKVKLDYPPGTGFQYSDTGFILLGEVVRRVTGEPLDRYLDRLLVRPLGLRDTAFRPDARLRQRTAATVFSQGRMLRGEVHDPRARLLGGVAGHAGLFSTADDLARICRMLLDSGVGNGRRVLRGDTIMQMWARAADGNGKRTLGWDMSSGYSLIHAPFFPARSIGHTGFTGTSVWLDPATRSYLILLTNRVHPNGGNAARIRELRVRVAAAVGAALFAPGVPPAPVVGTASDAPAKAADAAPPRPGETVRTGLDVLAAQNFALLRGHRVGLVTNQTGIDASGRRAIDLIAAAPGVKLQAIFSPEHGIGGTLESENVPHGRDAATGRPIWSLYGSTRRPDASMLQGVSILVFDLQDVGARYYTYLTTLVYVMEEAGRRGLPVVVLDRPNPITGRFVEGPLLDADLESFTGPHPIPVRTGLTIGEFARLAAAERKIPVTLTVVPLAGWDRGRWFDQTGLPWVNPSPNIRSVTQALLYSGIGLLEPTNLSVGRGTDMPFEVVGAPWIEPHALVEALKRRNLAGVRFEPIWFTPTADKYARVACAGVRFVVTDRNAIRPVTVALALAVELRERHRDQWRPESIQNLLVNRTTMWAFLKGEPLERLLAWVSVDRANFLNRRASYLIY